MKTKISKILGVLVTLGIIASLFASTIPVGAAVGVDQVVNEWSEVDLTSAIAPDTEVGVMAVTPDGIFAAVYSVGDGEWSIMKSTDGGVTWKDTKLATSNDTGLDDDNDWWWDDTGDSTPVKLAYSAPTKTLYVACVNGDIYRLKGDLEPVLLQEIVDSYGESIKEYNNYLYDIDVMYDGGSNFIVAATDLDVFVLKDTTFSTWLDMELATDGDYGYAVEVRFSPKFTTDQLVWAVVSSVIDEENELIVTSTDSPTRWGQVIDEVYLEDDDGDYAWWSPFVDMEFSADYNGTSVFSLYVAVADQHYADEDGGLWQVYGAKVPDESEAVFLDLPDTDIGSAAVSGDTIIAADTWDGTIYVSTDGGATFDEADKGPTGEMWGHVYMALNFATSKTAYFSGLDYGYGWATESAFNVSRDGGMTWNQTALVDTEIDEVESMVAVGPDGKKAFVITDNSVGSLWRTYNIKAEAPVWERVATEDNLDISWLSKVAFTPDGKTVMLYVNDGGDWKIMRSTDDGQIFKSWRTLPDWLDYAEDWFIVDANTVYLATDGSGFYATRALGPAVTGLDGYDLLSIDAQGSKIIVGDPYGDAYISEDKGATWTDGIAVGGEGDVYVAIGPDGKFYAAGYDSSVVEIALNDDDDWEATDIEDSDEATADAEQFTGIWVSPDNTLYALGGDLGGAGATVYSDPVLTAGSINLEGVLSGHTVSNFDLFANEVVSGFELSSNDGDIADTGSLHIDSSVVTAWSSDVVVGYINVGVGASHVVGEVTGILEFAIAAGIPADTFGGTSAQGEVVAVTQGSTALTYSRESSAPSVDATSDLFRLLLGETGNIWETANLDGSYLLGGSTGSNVLWTIVDGDELWALEDTLSGKVQGVTVTVPDAPTGETQLNVAWTAMTGAKQYEVDYGADATVTATAEKTTDGVTTAAALSKKVTGLTNNTKYTIKVRVVTGKTFQSRWSTAIDKTTLETITAPVAPSNLVPANGVTNVPVKGPAFVWAGASNAVKYEFNISKNPDFSSPVFTTDALTVPNIVLSTALENETAYYWRVRAVSATGTKSSWVNGVFTTVIKDLPVVTVPPATSVTLTVPPMVTVLPAPTPTINLPQPTVIVNPAPVTVTIPPGTTLPAPTLVLPEAETPVYIWIIVAVGALLTVAVIVLIIRTRRVV